MTTCEQQWQDGDRMCVNIPTAMRQGDDTTSLHTLDHRCRREHQNISTRLAYTCNVHEKKRNFETKQTPKSKVFKKKKQLPKKPTMPYNVEHGDSSYHTRVRSTVANIFVTSWKKEWHAAIVSAIAVDRPWQTCLIRNPRMVCIARGQIWRSEKDVVDRKNIDKEHRLRIHLCG